MISSVCVCIRMLRHVCFVDLGPEEKKEKRFVFIKLILLIFAIFFSFLRI